MMVQIILPALAQGQIVLADRFVSSTLAYQLGGDGLSAADIRAVAQIAIRGRWPDLTLLLDMPPEQSFRRMQREKDRIEQRPMEYHQQVRQNYLIQASSDSSFHVINADQSRDSVAADVWKAVQDALAPKPHAGG